MFFLKSDVSLNRHTGEAMISKKEAARIVDLFF
jgi:hypothetical protein